MLPFLLANINNNNNKDGEKQNKEQNIDSMQLIESLLKGDNLDNSSLISTLAKSSNNPQMATILNLAQNMNKKNLNKAHGLTPIIPFVNNDIMGKLTKFFTK